MSQPTIITMEATCPRPRPRRRRRSSRIASLRRPRAAVWAATPLVLLLVGWPRLGVVAANGGVGSWSSGNGGGWRPSPYHKAAEEGYPPYPGNGGGGNYDGSNRHNNAPGGSSRPPPSRPPPPPKQQQQQQPPSRPSQGGGGDYYQQQQQPQWQGQGQVREGPPSRYREAGYGSGGGGSSSSGGGGPPPPSFASDAYYPGPPQQRTAPPPPFATSTPAPPTSPDEETSLPPPPTSSSTKTSAPWHGADLSVLDKEQFFDELKHLYRKKVLPLELSSRYAQFHSAPLNPADFEAKPMVLLLGQYSVGKTSFIRSLLGRDFPGQRVGPEPTTDRFMAVMHGPEERLVPGHALAMQADKPFRGVAAFGNNFLTKFEAAEVPAPILRNITLIDSPGILSGEKQRLGRDYDYQSVIQWFADRADLIIIMFDAHKLDISDELRVVMDALRIHQDKIRILLNKADQIDSQQLMRIYGALMWSLGKVVNTPEVCRVYIGSFWEHPLQNSQNRFLLEKEKHDLLAELDSLPQNAVVRRINELVKRARSVKVHAYLIHYLRKQVPTMFGKSEKQAKLMQQLPREFVACARRYGLPLGDFPDINKFRSRLGEIKDLRKFPKLDKQAVVEMDRVFSHDIPKLLEKASRRPSSQPPPQQQQGGQYYGGKRGRR